MSSKRVPELLAPAGGPEKLNVAVSYGANAVYLGGQKFGLRSAADNFTNEEILSGIDFAHKKDVKVYVVLNSFFHNKDFDGLDNFVKFLDKNNVDGVIASDLGVIQRVKEVSNLIVHLSTQASCLNLGAISAWKELGIKRVILGREVSLKDIKKIKRSSDVEIEIFIHGSLCMTYSGNCVISNYTQGRDSNRGGCAQSCRFEYTLENEKLNKKRSFFMSSKDLCGIQYIPEVVEAGIHSLKIEGRMRSNAYLSTVTKVYREALDAYRRGQWNEQRIDYWMTELRKISHREYISGNLETRAQQGSIFNDREALKSDYKIAGEVLEVDPNNFILLKVKNKFLLDSTLELVPFKGENILSEASFIKNILGENQEMTRPGTVVKIPYIEGAQKYNIVRMRG